MMAWPINQLLQRTDIEPLKAAVHDQTQKTPPAIQYIPDFEVELFPLLNLESCHLVENLGLVEADQVVDNDVWRPEVVDHVAPDVNFTRRPVGRSIQ
jgi:hypothetical protein